MHDNFPLGSLIRSSVTETDINHQPVDPDTIKFVLVNPDDDVTEYPLGELIHTGIGTFYIQFEVDIPGQWFWRWEATGDGQAAKEGSFTVQRTRIPEP